MGAKLKMMVSCSAPDYAPVTRTSAATKTVAKARFASKGTATITGTPQVGSVLTVDEGTWTPTPGTYTYQWYRNGTTLKGQTAPTYTPTSTGTYTVKVTAKRAGYTNATATSASASVTTLPSSSLRTIDVELGEARPRSARLAKVEH